MYKEPVDGVPTGVRPEYLKYFEDPVPLLLPLLLLLFTVIILPHGSSLFRRKIFDIYIKAQIRSVTK